MNEAIDTMKLSYEAPSVTQIGSVHELTQGCNKDLGHADGFTFQGQVVVCQSSA